MKTSLPPRARGFLPRLLPILATFLILSSGIRTAEALVITIGSPPTAIAGTTIYFNIAVETEGMTVEKATLDITGPAQGIGISITCELSLDDGGEVSFIRKAGKATSSGKVTTEVAYDEYGYLIKYIFHVEWNTPITPTPYTIKLTVVADGVSFTQSKSIELLKR